MGLPNVVSLDIILGNKEVTCNQRLWQIEVNLTCYVCLWDGGGQNWKLMQLQSFFCLFVFFPFVLYISFLPPVFRLDKSVLNIENKGWLLSVVLTSKPEA